MMQITTARLQQIIKEEIQKANLTEQPLDFDLMEEDYDELDEDIFQEQ